MNISITGRGLEIGDSLRKAITGTVENFSKYNLPILDTSVRISSIGKNKVSVEYIVNLKQKHTIVITQKEELDEREGIYSTVGIAADRVEKALRRYSDKIKNHRTDTSLRDLPQKEEGSNAVLNMIPQKERQLILMDLELQKPIDIDEAINELVENKKEQFKVFNDRDGLMRIIYKREDGNIGMY